MKCTIEQTHFAGRLKITEVIRIITVESQHEAYRIMKNLNRRALPGYHFDVLVADEPTSEERLERRAQAHLEAAALSQMDPADRAYIEERLYGGSVEF